MHVRFFKSPMKMTKVNLFWALVMALVLIFNLIAIAKSCLFKSDTPSQKLEAVWNEDSKDYTINVKESKTCGMKFQSSGSGAPWHLYIHLKQRNGNTTSCSGTIIASNLLITSHECLTFNRETGNVFDTWNLTNPTQQRNLANTTDIILTTSETLTKGMTYNVTHIIYSPSYLQSIAIHDDVPKIDVAIIVTNKNLFEKDGHRPICLSNHDEDESVLEGLGALQEGISNNYVLKPDESSQPESLEGQILSIDKCIDKKRFTLSEEEEYNWWCFESPGLPLSAGAPLTYTSGTGNVFLLGLPLNHSRYAAPNNAGENFVLFIKALSLRKYFEYHATKHASVWYKTPKLTTDNMPSRPKNATTVWPWETIERPIKRDETLNCYCGIQNMALQSRIAGGETATAYEFGWMTLLFMNWPEGRSFCGGSIINDRLILTAAHCIVRVDAKNIVRVLKPEELDVYVNTHHRKHDPNARKLKVRTILYHPNFAEARKKYYYDYDIAVILLDEILQFPEGRSNGIRPLCLPPMGGNMTVVGLNSTVAGWGLMDPKNGSSAATELQKIKLPIRELSVCKDVARAVVTENFICAGTLNMYNDSASGDSGGPLMIQNEQKQFVEVGIVSWAQDIGQSNKVILTAAFYSDVQKLIAFVDYYSKGVKAQWCQSGFPAYSES